MKIKQVILLFFGVLILGGCESNKEEELIVINSDDIITMEVLDSYLGRDDVQYVDLRNFNSRFMSGYIEDFENIPFFDYLDYRTFDRNDSYEFSPDQILNTREIDRLFDKDKAIFLYADGCIRSGYVKDVLDYLGYERVFVLGGFYEYQGDHLIIGTGDFTFGDMFYSTYTSSTTEYTYYISGKFDIGKKIIDIRFDIVDENGITFRSTGYDEDIDYNEQLTILENYIVDDMVNFNQLYSSITSLSSPGYGNSEGYTLGFNSDLIALIETLVVK